MNYTYEKSDSQLDTESVRLKKEHYLEANSDSYGIICVTFGMNIDKIDNVKNLFQRLIKSRIYIECACLSKQTYRYNYENYQ